MRFGLFYEHQLPRPWSEGAEEQLLADALDQVELADRAGFDHVWEVEHHFLEEYSHSSAPEVFLAAASQRTSRIRLGHGIVQLPVQFNHPARVAERAATLDLISHGRVDLGTGEASSQAELGGFGVRRDEKRLQWDEALDVVCRMLVEEPFTGHRGTWIDVPPRNVVPKPRQKPHPPLWVACSRRETIELAARRGIGALSFSFVEPEDARPWVESYYRILGSPECVPAGFAVNPNVAVVLPFMCHRDEETAIARGIDGAHFFGYSLAHYYAFGRHRPGRTDIWEEFERHRNERGFARHLVRATEQPLDVRLLQGAIGSLRGAVGTPAQVADLVARYEAAGVDEVIFVAQAGRNRHEHICESIELFAAEVLPRFAEGRDEREGAKRERLAGAVEAALARRPAPPAPDVSGYVVSATGELAPARAPRLRASRTIGRPRSRRLAARAAQRAMAAAVARAPEVAKRALGTTHAAGRLYRAGMERAFAGADLGAVDAAIRFELRDGGRRRVVWDLCVAGGRARTAAPDGRDPDATVRLDVVDWLALVAGDLGPGEALFDGRLGIEGDDEKALAVLGALDPGMSPY